MKLNKIQSALTELVKKYKGTTHPKERADLMTSINVYLDLLIVMSKK